MAFTLDLKVRVSTGAEILEAVEGLRNHDRWRRVTRKLCTLGLVVLIMGL